MGYLRETDLSFYVNEASAEMTEEGPPVAEWEKKAAGEEGDVLVTVHGHTAIGRDRDEGDLSALIWMEQGLSLQYVSPAHTLDELIALAEAINFEQ